MQCLNFEIKPILGPLEEKNALQAGQLYNFFHPYIHLWAHKHTLREKISLELVSEDDL